MRSPSNIASTLAVLRIRQDRIELRGSKWVVVSEDGSRVLGIHDTKSEARRQLIAVEASKRRRETSEDR